MSFSISNQPLSYSAPKQKTIQAQQKPLFSGLNHNNLSNEEPHVSSTIGTVSLILALLTGGWGAINYSKEGATDFEKQIARQDKEIGGDVIQSTLADYSINVLKRGMNRVITGNKSSDKGQAKYKFKQEMNAANTVENHMLDLAKAITETNDNPITQKAMLHAVSEAQSTRSEYQKIKLDERLAMFDTDAKTKIGEWLQEHQEKKLNKALATLDENEREQLTSLIKEYPLSNERSQLLDLDKAQRVFETIVDTIVVKYEPEQVDAVRLAGKKLFAELEENREKIDAEAIIRNYFFMGAGGLGGFGLLAFSFGLLAASSRQKNQF